MVFPSKYVDLHTIISRAVREPPLHAAPRRARGPSHPGAAVRLRRAAPAQVIFRVRFLSAALKRRQKRNARPLRECGTPSNGRSKYLWYRGEAPPLTIRGAGKARGPILPAGRFDSGAPHQRAETRSGPKSVNAAPSGKYAAWKLEHRLSTPARTTCP